MQDKGLARPSRSMMEPTSPEQGLETLTLTCSLEILEGTDASKKFPQASNRAPSPPEPGKALACNHLK